MGCAADLGHLRVEGVLGTESPGVPRSCREVRIRVPTFACRLSAISGRVRRAQSGVKLGSKPRCTARAGAHGPHRAQSGHRLKAILKTRTKSGGKPGRDLRGSGKQTRLQARSTRSATPRRHQRRRDCGWEWKPRSPAR